MSDVLKVSAYARLKLKRNNVVLADHVYEPGTEDFTVMSSERVVLASSMSSPQEVSLGSINSTNLGRYLLLTTDKSVQVAIDDNTKLWTLADQGSIMYVGSFSHVYVKNIGTVEATIEYGASDGE